MNACATIAILDNAHCRAVKLFCDGYIPRVGKALLKHCINRVATEELISLADEFGQGKTERGNGQDLPLFIKPSTGYDNYIIHKLSGVSKGNYVYLFDAEKERWLVGVDRDFSAEEKALYPNASAGVFYPLDFLTYQNSDAAQKEGAVDA